MVRHVRGYWKERMPLYVSWHQHVHDGGPQFLGFRCSQPTPLLLEPLHAGAASWWMNNLGGISCQNKPSRCQGTPCPPANMPPACLGAAALRWERETLRARDCGSASDRHQTSVRGQKSEPITWSLTRHHYRSLPCLPCLTEFRHRAFTPTLPFVSFHFFFFQIIYIWWSPFLIWMNTEMATV